MPKVETRGRKSIPADQRKLPQTTVKINDAILPFVTELKSNLKNKSLTPEILQSLFDVLNSNGSSQDVDFQAENKELNALVRFQNNKLYELNDKPLAETNIKLESEIKRLKSQIEQLQHGKRVNKIATE